MAILDFDIYKKEFKKEMEQLNAKYVPIELDYSLDNEERKKYMVEWYQKTMDLLYKYEVTNSKLKTAIKKGTMEFREGAKEFIQKAYNQHIPIIILSAGIGNAIEEFLKQENCYYDNIYIISNFIEFKQDKMQKFEKEIIHTMNKTIQGKLPKNLQKIIDKKEYAVLFGDIIEDVQMIKSEKLDKIIAIGFLNYNEEKNLNVYKKYYDIVLTDEEASFYEIENIISQISLS